MFESKVKRQVILNSFLNSLPDVVVAVVIASFTDDKVLMFVFIFILIKAIYLLIWLKNSIWEWLLFYFKREQQVNTVYEGLIKDNYPCPKEVELSVDSYLDSIIADDNQSEEFKLKVVSLITLIQHHLVGGEFQKSLRISMVYEDALEKYKKYCENK